MSIRKSKLNARNTFQAINTWAVPSICYGPGIIEWAKKDLKYLDRKARKLITMHGGFQPGSNVQRLHIPRNEGGRGLIGMTDCFDDGNKSFATRAVNTNERMLRAAAEELNLKCRTEGLFCAAKTKL